MPRYRVTLEKRVIFRTTMEVDAKDEADATDKAEWADIHDTERFRKLEWESHDCIIEPVDCEEREDQRYASALSMALNRVIRPEMDHE